MSYRTVTLCEMDEGHWEAAIADYPSQGEFIHSAGDCSCELIESCGHRHKSNSMTLKRCAWELEKKLRKDSA